MVSEMVLRCLIGGEGRAQALVGDVQRPGSQPWENGSFLVLQIQRDSHAFPVLAVQGLVAIALSTLVPFRRIRKSMMPIRGLMLTNSSKQGMRADG